MNKSAVLVRQERCERPLLMGVIENIVKEYLRTPLDESYNWAKVIRIIFMWPLSFAGGSIWGLYRVEAL
jgi:hypothetical protein